MAKPCSHESHCIVGMDATVFVANAEPGKPPCVLTGCTLRWCKVCGATRCNDGEWIAPGTPIAIETVMRPAQEVSERKRVREAIAVVVLDAFLRDVRFDQHGTPDRKLPNCPHCEEDELWASAAGSWRGVSCYRCNFKRGLVLGAVAHA